MFQVPKRQYNRKKPKLEKKPFVSPESLPSTSASTTSSANVTSPASPTAVSACTAGKVILPVGVVHSFVVNWNGLHVPLRLTLAVTSRLYHWYFNIFDFLFYIPKSKVLLLFWVLLCGLNKEQLIGNCLQFPRDCGSI